MSIPIKQIMDLAQEQDGDDYVFGSADPPSDPDPEQFDCSNLVGWACDRNHVQPPMPRGSWIQAQHCKKHGTLIPVDQALKTFGALLFRFSSSPFTGERPDEAHVAFNLGNGKTFEARGRKYGVGSWSAVDRGWTHAGLIPGVDYD